MKKTLFDISTNALSREVNRVRKKYGIPKDGALPAKLFREACTNAKGKSVSGKNPSFSFSMRVEIIDDDTVEVILEGVHISKNRYNALSMRERMAYGSAIKKAAKECFVAYRNVLRNGQFPFAKATVHYSFFNKRSRDHDNGSETLKKFQDAIVFLGIIRDDNRKCLSCGGIDEIIDPEYKVIARIRKEQ